MENKSNQSNEEPVTKKPIIVPSLMESGILTPLKIQEAIAEENDQIDASCPSSH